MTYSTRLSITIVLATIVRICMFVSMLSGAWDHNVPLTVFGLFAQWLCGCACEAAEELERKHKRP